MKNIKKFEDMKHIKTQELNEDKKLNLSDISDNLSSGETLKLLMEIWNRIPLGTRMNCGGMEREIPKEIRELLDKRGYKIVKK